MYFIIDMHASMYACVMGKGSSTTNKHVPPYTYRSCNQCCCHGCYLEYLFTCRLHVLFGRSRRPPTLHQASRSPPNRQLQPPTLSPPFLLHMIQVCVVHHKNTANLTHKSLMELHKRIKMLHRKREALSNRRPASWLVIWAGVFR